MTHTKTRYAVIALEVFVGLMAIYGGISLLVDAERFGMKVQWLHGSPFTNYQIPAIALLIGVGGSSLLAAAALRARPAVGDLLAIGAGMVLMVFEVVETYSFGMRNLQQPLMFAIGLVVAALAAYLSHGDRSHEGEKRRFTYAH